MDRQTYKQVMDQIRMSDACEQKIQCAIKQGAQTRENPHHTVWKKVITALTAIVCVGVVGAFSVAAAQQINLWELFFSKAAEVTEPAVQTVSGVQNFAVSGFDGFTLEPMGVMHDAKQFRFVVRVSADENEMLSRIGSIHEVERLVRREDEIMINGTSIWDQTRTDGFLAAYTNCYGQKLEDGAYAIVFELQFQESLDDPEFTLQLPLAYDANAQALDDLQYLGTITAEIHCEQATALTVESDQQVEEHAVLNRMEIHAFGMELYGSGSKMPVNSMYADPYGIISVELTDGSTVTATITSVDTASTAHTWEFQYLFDTPIDPQQVTAIYLTDEIAIELK